MSKYADDLKKFVSSHKPSDAFEDWLSGKYRKHIRELQKRQQEREQAIDNITKYHKTEPVFNSTTYYDGLGRAAMIVSSSKTDKDVVVSVVRNDGSKWCKKESLDSSGQCKGR